MRAMGFSIRICLECRAARQGRRCRGGDRGGRGEEDPRVDARVLSSALIASKVAAVVEDTDGFVKVLANHETEEILGCHIIGTDASILIQEVANAMQQRLKIYAINQSTCIRPSPRSCSVPSVSSSTDDVRPSGGLLVYSHLGSRREI